MGILKFACATGVVAAAAGTAYLYWRLRKTPEQEEVNMQNEVLVMANDYIDFCMGIKRTPPNEQAKAMRYLAKQVEKMDGSALRPLVQSFLTSRGLNTWTDIRSVMLEVVGHENISWGNIVTLFAFTGILAIELSTGEDDVACRRQLAEMLTDVLIQEKQEWMIQNGGWMGFVDYVHSVRPQYHLLKSSLRTAFVAGVITGTAFQLISAKKIPARLVPIYLSDFQETAKNISLLDG